MRLTAVLYQENKRWRACGREMTSFNSYSTQEGGALAFLWHAVSKHPRERGKVAEAKYSLRTSLNQRGMELLDQRRGAQLTTRIGPQARCLRKFMNLCMKHGKRAQSRLIVSRTLARLSSYGEPSVLVLNAIENVKPYLEVKKVKISGATQLVPSPLSRGRQETLAIRWMLEAALKRRQQKTDWSIDQCLSTEILEASQQIGAVYKRREDLHRLAETNRGFSHYRWWL